MTARRSEFLGVPLDLINMSATLAAVQDHLLRGQPGVHLGVNAANLILAQDDPAYLAHLRAADLVTADGQSVVWGARMMGIRVPERVTGIDVMNCLLRLARERRWTVYLLGARASVVERLADRLRQEGVMIAGYRDGYFPVMAEDAVAAEVRDSGADILFVGMPSPRKERFAIQVARPAAIPFTVGVGGSFDVLAGEFRRAPGVLQKAGLEWIFRMLQEPRRLLRRYLVTNTRFLLLMLRAARQHRRHG